MRVFITGTSEGLGRELARNYLKHGHTVTGLSRSPSRIKHPRYHHFRFDLENCARGIPKIMTRANYDLVILNAAHAEMGKFVEQETNQIESMVKVNTLAPILLTHEILKGRRASKALFIFISSESCMNPQRGLAVYSSSKMAISTFSKVMSMEWSDSGYGFVQLVLGPIAIPAYLKEYRQKAKQERKTLKEFVRSRMEAKFPTFSNSQLITAKTIYRTLQFLKENQKHYSGSSLRLDHGVTPSPV